MDVRCHTGRHVERAGTHEVHLWAGVLTEHGDLAVRAAEDPLRRPCIPWGVDRVWSLAQQLNTVGLDQQVDDERASGLPLAVQAVTAVDEHRLGCQAVANRSARATALALRTHGGDAKCSMAGI